jgi:Do/DeqQ family serine protease
MHKLWLIFAQTATVCLGILFVVMTLKPEWLNRVGNAQGPQPVTVVREAAPEKQVAVRAANSYREAVRRAMPAVVSIYTTKEVKRHPFLNDPLFRRFFGEQLELAPQRSAGLGSGVVVNSEGYVLTNNHVIEAADEIEVLLANGKRYPAKVVGTDPDTDVAVLRIGATQLPTITFGDDDSLRLGDVVLAIGNPLGVGQTVTMGIVSGLRRNGLGINTFENFIQTDAAINQGNSGGALIDTAGNLVGINSAILSQTGGSIGIGFAIPVSTAKLMMEQIIATGTVTRGWIGVEAQDVTPELAESLKLAVSTGVIIAGLAKNGPADKAGVRLGDVLVAVEGKPVPDSGAMLNLIAQLTPGQKANFKVRRNNGEADVVIVVGRRPKPTHAEQTD